MGFIGTYAKQCDLSNTKNSLTQYLSQLNEPQLCDEEELELAEASLNGCKKSRERLICANLKLVVSIARKISKTSWNLLDLILEGNVGLIKAVDTFDPKRGARFSTFAAWQIKAHVFKAMDMENSLIKIPTRKKNEYNEDLKGKKITVSLDSIDLDSNHGFIEVDRHKSDDEKEDSIESIQINDIIHKELKNLSARERVVIESYDGINSFSMSFEKIGKELGISKQGARKSYQRAIEKMKKNLQKNKIESGHLI